MKKTLLIIYVTLMALFMAACSHDHEKPDAESLLPSGAGKPEAPSYNFSPELADPTSRFVTDAMELRYDTGGVIFSRETSPNSVTYTAVDLTTGDCASFSMKPMAVSGPVTLPDLTVNGQNTEVMEASVVKINETGVWIDILTPGQKHAVLVVTEL